MEMHSTGSNTNHRPIKKHDHHERSRSERSDRIEVREVKHNGHRGKLIDYNFIVIGRDRRVILL